jgi:hypothetical protein
MTAVSTATRRAERFFAEVADEFGERSGEIVTIPMRQCELARRKAVAASTVAAHVRAMGERVLQRHPMIVIADGRAPTGSSPQPSTNERDADLVAALNDVVQAQQRLIDLLMNSATAESRIVAGSRGIVADPTGQGTSRPQVSKEEPSLRPLHEPIRDDRRGNVAGRADGHGSTAWSLEDLDQVLAPLHDIVRKRGLKPMNNRAALVTSVADRSLPEIDTAVHRLTAMTADGTVRSPFGLLVSWARRNESHMFFPLLASHQEPPIVPTCPVVDEVADSIEADAARTIAAWEADPDVHSEQLESIDHQIVTDNGAIPLIDAVAPLRHAFRVEALSLRLRRANVLGIHDSASANAHVSALPPPT